MAEIIRFPSVFKGWEQTESIVRKNLAGLIPKKDEDYIVSRFKETFEKLPQRIPGISIELKGTEKLRAQDMETIHAAINSAMDQLMEQTQAFAGNVLGEVFALVFDLWKCEIHRDDIVTGEQTSNN